MMVLGVPAVDNHDLTQTFIDSLIETVGDPDNFRLVIIDNDSEKKYKANYNTPFITTVIHNKTNKGYYYPLLQLKEAFPDADYYGLSHNDVTFYEKDWDKRMVAEFALDHQLGCIGLCGSWAIDGSGGRSYGTVCNFRGDNGQPQANTGAKISDRKPSISLDSLFMMFRRGAIESLRIDENIGLCHFFDRIWTLRLWGNGWRVIVLGIEIDHWGGRTSCAPKYQEDAKKWCKKRGIPVMNDNGDLTIYKYGEQIYLTEFEKYIPSIVDDNYNIRSHT